MEKYIGKLISLGMCRNDAEIFIDGLTKIILERNSEPVHAILPRYYKIKVMNGENNLGYIKAEITNRDMKFLSEDDVEKVIRHLVEHDAYRHAFRTNPKNIEDLKRNTSVWFNSKDWYNTIQYGIYTLMTDWKIGKDDDYIFVKEPFFD